MGHVRNWGRTPLGQKTVSTGGSGMTPPPPESCLLSCFISRFSFTLAWAPMCLNCFSFSHPLTSPLLWTFGPIFFCQGNLPPTHIFYWQTFTLLLAHKWDMALPRRTPSPWDKAPSFPIPPSPDSPVLAPFSSLSGCKSSSCVFSRDPRTCLGAWAQVGSVFGGWLWKQPGGRWTSFQVSNVSTCFSFPLGVRT